MYQTELALKLWGRHKTFLMFIVYQHLGQGNINTEMLSCYKPFYDTTGICQSSNADIIIQENYFHIGPNCCVHGKTKN